MIAPLQHLTMWTTPPTRTAVWGLAATIVTVVLGVALIAAAWARGDMFGQRCRVAGRDLDGDGLQRCVAQLAKSRGRPLRPLRR